jgi:hypothetical protein
MGSLCFAADTAETFGIGASDFELYLGFDGVGLGKYEKTISAEAVAGFGFVDRFSGFLTTSIEGNEQLSKGTGGAGFGVFGTPVDTNHFDMDLFLAGGFSVGAMHIAPAIELNLDAAPDLALYGIYFRAAEIFEGRDDSIEDDPSTVADETHNQYTFAPTTALTVGAYVTIAESHQILIEFDTAFHHNTDDASIHGSSAMDVGAVALGYNVILGNVFELISQVTLDIPNTDEKLAAGFLLGFIASMPSSSE